MMMLRRLWAWLCSWIPGRGLIPHEVIDWECFRRYKISYTVRVRPVGNRLPNKAELVAISRKLRSKRHTQTFVEFLLPGMEPGSGCFAFAHHRGGKLQFKLQPWFAPEEYAHLT